VGASACVQLPDRVAAVHARRGGGAQGSCA